LEAEMLRIVISLAAGTLFGVGLAASEMVNPARVLGFLDVAGTWDPTLAYVMGGALAFAAMSFHFVLRRNHPILAPSFSLATKVKIDRPLLGGAALFGLGWGLAGYCPGPALASLSLGRWEPYLFVGAMLVGMGLHRTWSERLERKAAEA
jgi:uncharacterized membrane protein YedE/YeeE